MENNLQGLSAGALDQLLKQAFLSQDFDVPKNQQMLDLIAEQAMRSIPQKISFKKITGRQLFFLASALAFLGAALFLIWPAQKNTPAEKSAAKIPEDKKTIPETRQEMPESLSPVETGAAQKAAY